MWLNRLQSTESPIDMVPTKSINREPVEKDGQRLAHKRVRWTDDTADTKSNKNNTQPRWVVATISALGTKPHTQPRNPSDFFQAVTQTSPTRTIQSPKARTAATTQSFLNSSLSLTSGETDAREFIVKYI